MNKIAIILGCAAMTGANATAGFTPIVNIQSFNDNSTLVSNYQSLIGSTNTRINTIDSATSSSLSFTGTEYVAGTGNAAFAVNIASNDSRNFYLGAASGLTDAWFSQPRPDNTTETLAFGNSSSATNTNSVTLSFVPGVTAFGFNYDDVESANLLVTWSGGGSTTQTISSTSGFLSFVAGTGGSITSITLTQSPDLNDGFTFYGFQTVQVVPVPTAALAGLGLLGGMGVARRIRRR